jgi:subtilase family serine protease
MSRRFGSILTIAAAIGIALVAYKHLGAQTRTLITQPIDDHHLVTLRGHTHPAARLENDRGPVAESTRMDGVWLQLNRPPEKQKAFEKFLDEQQDPNSPNYHKWLTATQVGDQFGPSPEDIATVKGWLESSGFKVNHVYPHGTLIDFSGTVGQIQHAFHTEIHNFEVNGKRHYANVRDPQIPAALMQIVAGPVSLHNFMPHPMLSPITNYTVSTSYHLIAPGDLYTIYNLNPAFTSYTGKGVTIVVIEDTDVYSTGDWSVFRKYFGLGTKTAPYGKFGTFTQVHPAAASSTIDGFSPTTCTPPGVNSDDSEAILDAEWASAAAPDASIVLASCLNTSNFGGFIALQNMLTNGGSIPAVVSISYGDPESDEGTGGNAYINSLYQLAASEGVSLFVSSGDQGAASADYNAASATHGIQVSGYTTTPYNVSVGGTDFGDSVNGIAPSTYWGTNGANYNSALSYIREIPWNDSCAGLLLAQFEGYSQTYGSAGYCNSTTALFLPPHEVVGGSGGPSTVYSKPGFQSGFVGNPVDGKRDVPDVSLFAANGLWGHYYVVCYSDTAHGGTSCLGQPSAWSGFGGTSVSSPIMAGIMALVVQKKGAAQGNPLPRMYAMAGTTYGGSTLASCNSSTGGASACIYYDITQGDMDVNCTGTNNCYLPSGTYGVLSTSNSAYQPAYGTGTGWDFATGIGSVNAANFVSTY